MNPSENSKSTPAARPDVAGLSAAGLPGRRRLLRAGLMGAPALLALTSAPVLAANCKLPSGFSASGNLSRTGSKNCSDAALKPSAWSSKIDGLGNYSGTTISPGTKFKSPGFTAKYFANSDTFSAVLGRGDIDIAALAATAFLTALAGGNNSTTFPTSITIVKMWNDGVAGAGYTGTTGVVWQEAEVKNYLLYLTGQA